MLFLCLVAALLGTPLRQAEAAEDFARAMAGIDQDHDIESVDGGVGDDPELSITEDPASAIALPDVALLVPAFWDILRPTSEASRLVFVDAPRHHAGDRSARRLARLQRFRF